jgi:glycosyltransferase involved in cell wall biosynthesis
MSFSIPELPFPLETAIAHPPLKKPLIRPEIPIYNSSKTVLALIPHFQCEPWLKQCLTSLIQQTRLLDRIVVIDDHSPEPPIALIEQFPTVTLLASSERVGPYRLVQQVINQTNFDTYLFQDADDWSSCDRLNLLLRTMETTGADLVGTQELRVVEDELIPVTYPLDVNAALSEKPGHPLLHPTSLVTRKLVMDVGGFATGLRFGGDSEFLLRAKWLAKIVNIPEFCYFRRKRPQSLTTDPETGLESPARLQLLRQIKQRAIANLAAHQAHQPLCLSPLCQAPPISLQYLIGPQL